MTIQYFYYSSKYYYGKEAGWVECSKEQYQSLSRTLPECPLKIVIVKNK